MASASLSVTSEDSGTDGAIALVRPSGQIDTETAPLLDSALLELVARGRLRLLVDLSAVTYVSSTGWGTMVGQLKTLRSKGGDLRLCGLKRSVREVFELLQFQTILRAYATSDEAVSAWGEAGPSEGPSGPGGEAPRGSAADAEELRRHRPKGKA